MGQGDLGRAAPGQAHIEAAEGASPRQATGFDGSFLDGPYEQKGFVVAEMFAPDIVLRVFVCAQDACGKARVGLSYLLDVYACRAFRVGVGPRRCAPSAAVRECPVYVFQAGHTEAGRQAVCAYSAGERRYVPGLPRQTLDCQSSSEPVTLTRGGGKPA